MTEAILQLVQNVHDILQLVVQRLESLENAVQELALEYSDTDDDLSDQPSDETFMEAPISSHLLPTSTSGEPKKHHQWKPKCIQL